MVKNFYKQLVAALLSGLLLTVSTVPTFAQSATPSATPEATSTPIATSKPTTTPVAVETTSPAPIATETPVSTPPPPEPTETPMATPVKEDEEVDEELIGGVIEATPIPTTSQTLGESISNFFVINPHTPQHCIALAF